MFERYTERARRVIFFARYESSQFGSTVIESEHLLLGVLREDKNLLSRFIGSEEPAHAVSDEVAALLTVRPKISTAMDLPLSTECKNILRYAFEEAEKLNHHHVGVEHLVLGILREGHCAAAGVLQRHGLRLDELRQKMGQTKSDEDSVTDRQFSYSPDDAKRVMAKRLLFTIAYRFERAFDGAPEQFESFRPAPNEKTPHDIVRHMTNMVTHVCGQAREATSQTAADFVTDLKDFRKSLDDLRIELESGEGQQQKLTPEKMIQGVLSELLVDIGQLMLLRSLAGSPVNPKDYWTSDPPG